MASCFVRTFLAAVLAANLACGVPIEGAEAAGGGASTSVSWSTPTATPAIEATTRTFDGAEAEVQTSSTERSLVGVMPGSQVNLTVQVANSLLPNGGDIEAALALMGCGYYVSARSVTSVGGGAATVVFPASAAEQQSMADVFLLEDVNASGDCDAADRIFKLSLTSPMTGSHSIDLAAQAPVENWYCFIFSPEYGP